MEKKTDFTYFGIQKEFLELESKYNLFKIREVHGVYIWKLVRYNIFRAIIMHKLGIKQIHLEVNKFDKYKNVLSMFINSFFKNPLFKKSKRLLVLDNPRKVTLGNHKIDPQTYFFLKNLREKEYELLERRYVGKIEKTILSTNSNMDFLMILNKLYKPFIKKNISLSLKTEKILNELEKEILVRFGIELNIKRIVQDHTLNFISIYKVFSYLIKRSRAEKLYLVGSYGSEAYIAAAQDNHVKVIEFQHGVIGPYHLGYHFPHVDSVPYFPDEILLFGEFWDRTTSLPLSVEKTYYGYPYLKDYITKHKENIYNKVNNQIIIISQGTIGQPLSKFVFELAKKLPNYHFVYKLHPGEFGRWKKDYLDLVEMSKLPNVEVYENEKNLYDLFSKSKFVLGVASTAIFEAIAFRVEPIIVKLHGYEYMNDLHNQYNVPVLESTEQVQEYIENYDVNKNELNVDIESLFHELYS